MTSWAPVATWAFDGDLQVAIVLSQRLIGRKEWTR